MIIWFDKSAVNKVLTATQAKAMVASIQTLIDTLMAAAAAAALNADIQEYGFNDSLTHTKVVYKDVGAISAQIKGLISLQQIYLQMPGVNSRIVRLIDRSNMPNVLPFNTCQ